MTNKYGLRNLPYGVSYIYNKLFKSKNFTFNKKTYEYFYHKYNHTWLNERIVELPIIIRFIKSNRGKNILEVGNVLSHYMSFNHDIVDKYEKGKNVINKDILDFDNEKKYDLIVSVSTMEHIGYDENLKYPERLITAFRKLRSMLSKNGIIVVTLPVGYNEYMDGWIKNKRIEFDKLYYMKRTLTSDIWVQTNYKGVSTSKYNHPFKTATGIMIGIIEGNKK